MKTMLKMLVVAGCVTAMLSCGGGAGNRPNGDSSVPMVNDSTQYRNNGSDTAMRGSDSTPIQHPDSSGKPLNNMK